MSDMPNCPACSQPAHEGWSGTVINAMFLDFEKGGYSNTKEYGLICPDTGKQVRGTRINSGDRSGGVVEYILRLEDWQKPEQEQPQ